MDLQRNTVVTVGLRTAAFLMVAALPLAVGCDKDDPADPGADACVIEFPDGGGTGGVGGESGVGGDSGNGGTGGDAGTGGETDAGTDAEVEDADVPDAVVDGAPDCDDEDGGVVDAPFEFTEMERGMLATLTPLPAVPADTTNAFADDANAAALGQKFFFDKRFSGSLAIDSDLGTAGETDKIACASCHQGPGMDDQRTALPRRVSLGANFHSRNAPSAINSVFYKWTNWGGRFSAPWELPIAVVEAGVIMNGNRVEVAHIIYDHYRVEYESIFGPMDGAIALLPATGKPKPAPTPANPTPADGNWELLLTDSDRGLVNRVLINFGKTIEAYERLLVSRDAPFDQLAAGDDDGFDDAEKRGTRLFLSKARCVNCHNGPLLSDNQFHNLGVPQGVMGSTLATDHVPASDDGRFKDVPGLFTSPFSTNTSASDNTMTGRFAGLTNPAPEETRGAFRTPTLRGVTRTAPYMHSGQFSTLEEVIQFYDAGGVGFGGGASGARDPLLVPLHLTDQERADLLAFLRTLDGEPVPAPLLVDPFAP